MNSVLTTNISGTANDFDRPSGTGALCIATQALRAWLRSACPSGTKGHCRPRIKLALMGFPWVTLGNPPNRISPEGLTGYGTNRLRTFEPDRMRISQSLQGKTYYFGLPGVNPRLRARPKR
jgi:hypothetical protein